MQPILNGGIIWPGMAVLMILLVYQDRAFPRKTRKYLYAALALCFSLSVISQLAMVEGLGDTQAFHYLSICSKSLCYPVIILTLIWSKEPFKRIQRKLMLLPVVLGCLAFLLFPGDKGFLLSYIVFGLYLTFLIVLLIKRGIDGTFSSILLAIVLLFLFSIAIWGTNRFNDPTTVNGIFTLAVSFFYYHMIMSDYRMDALTGVMLRRNLNFSMEENIDKSYYICLIDIDNFKLINDKYGHDAGDLALVHVVRVIKDCIDKTCMLYRFGGDEFVIISKKRNDKEIADMLNKANVILEKEDYHFSYGIVRHEPGDASDRALFDADKAMYANKRLLKSESIWDDMTGLYNFQGFLDELESFRKAARRDGHGIGLISLDIERLSSINMAYGYNEGNDIIQTVTRVLKLCTKGREFLGHLGSDEFVAAIELSETEDTRMDDFIASVKSEMDRDYYLKSKDYSIVLNYGRFEIPEEDTGSADDWVNSALYMKQTEKDNRYRKNRIDDPDDFDPEEEVAVLDMIDNNKLSYAYQPIVSAKNGEIVAYEALMRSTSESKITPLKILKYAAKNGRTYEIERLTFNNVLREYSIEEKIPDFRRIFINSIPGYILTEADFGFLKGKYENVMDRMVVEVTESNEMTENELAILNRRRSENNFHIALDDYGTGYSNTGSLIRYNAEIIKMDRMLISGIDRNSKKQFFVKSLIEAARENDIQVLAEGVETINELKMLVRMGVDLIQGYVCAKPKKEVIDEIPPEIRKIIINENIHMSSGSSRKVFTAGADEEISLVHLAMEEYTRVNISTQRVKLIGGDEYSADMSIHVKEGLKSELTLVDARINSIDGKPCIELGENVDLTIHLEGNSKLNSMGIHVPESSSLTIDGTGNLRINVKGSTCYGIGSDIDNPFGRLTFKSSGTIAVITDGEECIGIGGGISSENSYIDIRSGIFDLTIAGINGTAIGAMQGNVNMNISECVVIASVKTNEGCAIGSLHGGLKAELRNFNINISGSGRYISGIGNNENHDTEVAMRHGTLRTQLNGHMVQLLGINEGYFKLDALHVRLNLLGEGDQVLAFGNYKKDALVNIEKCSTEIIINAADPYLFGCEAPTERLDGTIDVNGAAYW